MLHRVNFVCLVEHMRMVSRVFTAVNSYGNESAARWDEFLAAGEECGGEPHEMAINLAGLYQGWRWIASYAIISATIPSLNWIGMMRSFRDGLR